MILGRIVRVVQRRTVVGGPFPDEATFDVTGADGADDAAPATPAGGRSTPTRARRASDTTTGGAR